MQPALFFLHWLICWFGLAIGLYFLPEKPMAIYTIAVLVNLVLLRFAYRGGKDQIGKGIVMMTFFAMILYLVTHKVTV